MAQPETPPAKQDDGELNIGRRVDAPPPKTNAPAPLIEEKSTKAVTVASVEPPAATSSERSLYFDAPIPAWMMLVLVAALGASVWRAYSRTTRRVLPKQKGILIGLRALTVLLMLVCIARPVVVHTQQLHENGMAFIALDASSSMTIRDGASGLSRWSQASDILLRNAVHVRALRERFDLQRYKFDRTARPVAELPGENPSLNQSPDGPVTDLAALLETIATESGGLPAAGAILISDGRHNASRDVLPAALQLERSGVPLYVIGLGQDATPTDFKDIRIRDLVVPEKAFIGSQLVLRVEAESTLPSAAQTPLIVEVNGKRVHESIVSLQPGNNILATPVEVPFSPQTLGIHRVVATLGAFPDEANFTNNSRSAFFRVYRTRLGIWYVEGAVRKEFGSLRTALETAPNVSMKSINAFMARTSVSADLLPSSAEDKAQLRLVILGDISPSRFDPDALRALASFVEKGGALLTLGGLNSYANGDWQNTPLAPVFPVTMGAGDGLRDGPLSILLENSEVNHPIVAVGSTPEHTQAMWRSLPQFAGLNRITAAKPAARVLLRADTSPLLVVQDYGRGRVASFMGETTWQWVLKGDQADMHKRFWRGMVTWLTRSDYSDNSKAVFVDSERLHYQAGDDVSFRTFVHELDKSVFDIKKAPIIATLSRVTGETELQVFKEEIGKGVGEYTKHLALTTGGSYRFRASAMNELGVAIDSDSIDIQVSSPDIEHDNPKANLKLLRRIANLSGGMYFDPPQASQAFEALLKRDAGFSKTITDVTDVWNRPWMLLLILLSLSAEWFLRKRWALI